MEKMKLFFGTANQHKLKEIRQILGEGFQILSFEDGWDLPAVEETENTLEGNAALKAKAFFLQTRIPCFSDDTGLEVNALEGRPGVFSARYAGPEANAVKNMEKLIFELRDKADRSAQFRTVISFFDGNSLLNFDGALKGRIGISPTGTNGFGYDPIFIPEGYEKSLAEFSAIEKGSISHRAIALKKLVNFLHHEYRK